ncbi:MAG TPA: family 10 glycosylhydrolase [Bacteroidota bacterium]
MNRTRVGAAILSLSLLASSARCATPVREVRAVWITTVNGLDWPKSYDVSEQKQSLVAIIDRLAAAHYNTVFFQVRSRADAMYRSGYEPWSQQLTGVLGKDPGWDPLALVLEQAHARGMEVHAWFNTFYARSGRALPPQTSPPHVILKHPDWVRLAEGEWWFDPGVPAARRYVLNVAMDLVRHYDIDGIHFDFLRYPAKLFPDESTFRKYGGTMSKEDWRRENINMFVRAFYDSATSLKPMLKVGSAPIGIYSNIPNVSGLQSYSDLYQDSREWLREGKQDYLVPQTYWPFGARPGSPDFGVVAKDWALHTYGREVYLGIGAYKPEVFDQIPQMIDVTRSLGFPGNSFFRYGNIERSLEVGGRYKTLAIIPAMRWKDSIPPNPPASFAVTGAVRGGFRLEWAPPREAADGDEARSYAVYRSTSSPVDVGAAENLIALLRNGATRMSDTVIHPASARYFYAVSALDKGNNESAPVESSALLPEIVEALGRIAPSFRLGRAYPEPASSILFIPYELGQEGPVRLSILDEHERPVADLVRASQLPGRYVASGDLSKLKAGVYSLKLVAGTLSASRTFRIQN